MFKRPLLFLGFYFVLIGIVKFGYVLIAKNKDGASEHTEEIEGA